MKFSQEAYRFLPGSVPYSPRKRTVFSQEAYPIMFLAYAIKWPQTCFQRACLIAGIDQNSLTLLSILSIPSTLPYGSVEGIESSSTLIVVTLIERHLSGKFSR